ncbi:MAG: PBSX family phage terminase large subunit [Clostridiales bacterium]|nr:PBSX family phage terminase large subunit [Clostridiales bacterium]
MKIEVNKKLFIPTFLKLFNKEQRYQIIFGGAGSGKSYNIFTMSVLWAIQGRSILVVRQNQSHLKKSVFTEINKAIGKLGMRKGYFDISINDKSFACKVSKGSIQCIGVNDPEKIKSISPIQSDSFDTVIIEEATELTMDQFEQVLLRQRGQSKFPLRTLMLFNPINITHHLYKTFFSELEVDFNKGIENLYYEDKDLLIHKSTFVDNPYNTKDIIKAYEKLKETSPEMYNVYGLGNFGVFGDRVYSYTKINKSKLEEMLKNNNYEPRCGIDIGYTDYMTFTINLFNKRERKLITVDEYCKKNVSDIEKFAKSIKKILIKNDLSEKQLISIDSNDPRVRKILIGFGLNIKKAKKGPNSKLPGILHLKTIDKFVLNSCKDTIRSYDSYVWKKDTNGETTDKTEHTGSDIMDSIRYSIEGDILNKVTTSAKLRLNNS